MPVKEAWGLDIAKRAVRMVQMRRQGAQTYITAFGSKPLHSPLDDPDYEEKAAEALEELVDELGVGNRPVYVSVSGPATFFRDLPLPSISAGKLDEIVSYEARQQIPYPLEEVLWDYHEQISTEDASEIYVSLVCCRRDIVAYRLEMLKELGLNVSGFQVGPVALANFLLHDQPPEGTTLLLDAGARATDFLVLRDNGFWLRSISTAGNDITQALMRKFNLPFGEAEELKHKMAESKQADRVFQVVKPVLRSLGGEVQRSLGYYKSLYRGVRLEQVICTGGSFQLPGMTEFIGEEIGLPVKQVQEVQSLEFGPEADEDAFNRQRYAYAVAAGLALQGVSRVPLRLNLLPPEEKRAQLIRSKRPYAIAAVALLAVATVVGLLTSAQRTDQWDSLIQQMDRVVGSGGTLQRAEDAFERAKRSVKPHHQRLQTLARAATGRGQVAAATETIYRVFEDLNAIRAELAESELAGRAEAYFREEAVQTKLQSMEAEATNYEEIVQSLRTQAWLRAKRITDRRRRVFIEQVTAEPKQATWFVTDPDERSEGQAPALYSPAAAEAAQEADDDLELEEYPVEVIAVQVTGFSVSKREELTRDVTGTSSYSLATIFGQDIPGVFNVRIDRKDFASNEVPVPAYKYASVLSDTEAEQTRARVSWETIAEETIPFEIELVYLPDRYRDGYALTEADGGVKTMSSADGEAETTGGSEDDQTGRARRRRRR